MCFDDPIYLDHESFDDLVEDTEQCRICWMYHDILSDIKIAGMFARYAGSGAPTGEARTAVAWVAAGREENSFYLLFKWYDDFCSPPERGDLYYVEREQGPDGEVRVRQLNLDFQNQLGPQGQAWCRSLWTKVSANASRFFGDSEFETSPIGRILRLLDDSPGQELEVFDWYLGRKSDGEKAAQCATIAAYFWGIQSIEEIIYHIVVTDGGENAVHYLHTRDFLEILGRLSGAVDMKRLSELGGVFQELADGFCRQPVRSPTLSRSAGPHRERGNPLASADGPGPAEAAAGVVLPVRPPAGVGRVPPLAGGAVLHRPSPSPGPGPVPGGLPPQPV